MIVVDDGSTDSTPEIIASFVACDPRIRSIRHAVNRKLPAALNTGFHQARGEFLTWTSDDNRYYPQALERMVDFLLNHPEVDLVYTDWDTLDKNGRVTASFTVKPPEKLVFGCIVGPCFLYHRKVMEKVGDYSEDLFYVEDYDYWLRVAVHFRIQPLHETLYGYRQHRDSLTAKRGQEAGIRGLIAQERSVHRISWVSRAMRGEALLEMAGGARQHHDLSMALKFLLRSVFLSPTISRRAVHFVCRRLGITTWPTNPPG